MARKTARREFVGGLIGVAVALHPALPLEAVAPSKKPVGWFLELEMDGQFAEDHVRRHFYPAAEYDEEYVRDMIFGETAQPWVKWRKLTPLYA